MTTPDVVVVPYDPAWPGVFESIRARVWGALEGVALAVEHVGSTSVPGLAAKPIIDVDVIIPSEAELPEAVRRLAGLGYQHLGDLGIAGRDAFRRPTDTPRHNLYVCPQGSLGLQNHLALRDELRADPEAARRYGELKLDLARRFPNDIEGYVEAKTAFILELLRRRELTDEQRAAIERANRRRG